MLAAVSVDWRKTAKATTATTSQQLPHIAPVFPYPLSQETTDTKHRCARVVIKSRIPLVFCIHTVPFPRWSCLQKKSHFFSWLLCSLEGNIVPSIACDLTGGPQPRAKYHRPCQPSSWSAAPSSSLAMCCPKLVIPWLSCSMDVLSKLCPMGFSQKHVTLIHDNYYVAKQVN